MKSNSQEQVAEKLGVAIQTVKNVSSRAITVGLKSTSRGTCQVINPEVLNDLLPSQRDIEAYKRFHQEDRDAIAAATNVKTKAEQLLDTARQRKAEHEKVA